MAALTLRAGMTGETMVGLEKLLTKLRKTVLLG